MRIKTVLLCFSLCITAYFCSATNYAYAEENAVQMITDQMVEEIPQNLTDQDQELSTLVSEDQILIQENETISQEEIILSAAPPQEEIVITDEAIEGIEYEDILLSIYDESAQQVEIQEDVSLNVENVQQEEIVIPETVVLTEQIPENASETAQDNIQAAEFAEAVDSELPLEVMLQDLNLEAPVKSFSATPEEIELLCALTWAEARGEDDYGKRLVIDTVLNRVEHEKFPNTIREVVYARGQFSPAFDGSLNRGYGQITEELRTLVKEELANRTNNEVIYFNAIRFMYGRSLFKHGGHYFSAIA